VDPAIIISAVALVVAIAAFIETRRTNRRREQAHFAVEAQGAYGDGGSDDHVMIRLKNIGASDAMRVRVRVRAKGQWSEPSESSSVAVGEKELFSLALAPMSVMVLPTPGGRLGPGTVGHAPGRSPGSNF
jgi:hypothetical protein